jgi:hypothetical protein
MAQLVEYTLYLRPITGMVSYVRQGRFIPLHKRFMNLFVQYMAIWPGQLLENPSENLLQYELQGELVYGR